MFASWPPRTTTCTLPATSEHAGKHCYENATIDCETAQRFLNRDSKTTAAGDQRRTKANKYHRSSKGER